MALTTLKITETDTEVVKRLLTLRKGATVFHQGELADAIFFVQTGQLKITVISAYSKEAMIRVLGPDDFLGEECLVDGFLRTCTATCLKPSTVFRIEKHTMAQALHIHPELSLKFLASLLVRRINLQRELLQSLFNDGNRALGCAPSRQ